MIDIEKLQVMGEEFTLRIDEVNEIQEIVDSIITSSKLLGYEFQKEYSKQLSIKTFLLFIFNNNHTTCVLEIKGKDKVAQFIEFRHYDNVSVKKTTWVENNGSKGLKDLFNKMAVFI